MIRFVLLKEYFGYGVENGLDLQTQLGQRHQLESIRAIPARDAGGMGQIISVEMEKKWTKVNYIQETDLTPSGDGLDMGDKKNEKAEEV